MVIAHWRFRAAPDSNSGFKLSSCVNLGEFHGFWPSVCPRVFREWSSSISSWQDCKRWKRLKVQSVLTVMPEYENRWPCLWCCSPHFITFSSSELTHVSKIMWNYHGRWKVQRIWCQNTAKRLRLSTCQANPWQLQRTWETCIPVSAAPLQLVLISGSSSAFLARVLQSDRQQPAVLISRETLWQEGHRPMQGLKRKERRVFWAAAWRGAETQHSKTSMAGLPVSSFYPRCPQVLISPRPGLSVKTERNLWVRARVSSLSGGAVSSTCLC